MNLEEFKLSLSDELPPIDLNDLLQALWLEARGDWEPPIPLPRKIRAMRVPGYMLISTRKREICPMPPIGIPGPAEKDLKSHFSRNGIIL
jgi:hypothetical protein